MLTFSCTSKKERASFKRGNAVENLIIEAVRLVQSSFEVIGSRGSRLLVEIPNQFDVYTYFNVKMISMGICSSYSSLCSCNVYCVAVF